jgi:hypothetical protein
MTKICEAAVHEYGKTIELDATYAKPMKALARVYLKTGRVDEAKRLLETSGKADPSMKESALLLRNFNEEFRPSYAVKKRKRHGKNLKMKRRKDIKEIRYKQEKEGCQKE